MFDGIYLKTNLSLPYDPVNSIPSINSRRKKYICAQTAHI